MKWDDIAGNKDAVLFLQRFFKVRQKPHALLILGQEGSGKRLLADTFAQTVFCGNDDEACDICVECSLFKNESHPDFFVIQPELTKDGQKRKGSIGIAQIKELMHETAFPPKRAENRVVIIDGAHLMTEQAANSLLKLLEEPPTGWIFILLSMSQDMILPTILSRVTTIRLQKLHADEIIGFLQKKYPDALNIEAAGHLSDGSVGQALRYTTEEAGVLRRDTLDFMLAAVNDQQTELAAFASELDKEKAIFVCEYMTFFIRDIWQLKYSGKKNIWNVDMEDQIEFLGEKICFEDMKDLLKNVQNTLWALKRSANPRLAMEGLYLKIADAMK